jgi:transposase InsO family protein
VATVYLKAAFSGSGKSYGSRRLASALQAQGLAIGRYRVRRLMREAALRPVWKRRFIQTTHSRHDLPVAENLLNRQFEADAPNQTWVSDITYGTPSQPSLPAWGRRCLSMSGMQSSTKLQ